MKAPEMVPRVGFVTCLAFVISTITLYYVWLDLGISPMPKPEKILVFVLCGFIVGMSFIFTRLVDGIIYLRIWARPEYDRFCRKSEEQKTFNNFIKNCRG